MKIVKRPDGYWIVDSPNSKDRGPYHVLDVPMALLNHDEQVKLVACARAMTPKLVTSFRKGRQTDD